MYGLVVVLGSLAMFGMCWFVLPFSLRKLEVRRLEQRCRDQRAIVLTYDDGPDPDLSNALMDLLSREGVPATFFVIGRNAEGQPDLLQRQISQGFEVANHTQNHTNAWKVLPWTANRDISNGAATLRQYGVTTALFRPPFGKTTPASLLYRFRHGLCFAFWTIDTRDSWDRRPVEDVLNEIHRKGGGVILMHDFGTPKRGPKFDNHQKYVLDTTSRIIALAREQNMVLLRFGDLM